MLLFNTNFFKFFGEGVKFMEFLVILFSELNQLSGVAAILRFPVNDPESDEEDASSDEEKLHH